MAYDGPPITRKVPGAWTGVLVSGELAIDIPAPAAANKKPVERAKLLARHVDQFTLAIRYFGPPDKKNPRISLTLRVPKVPPEARRLAHWPAVQISKAQALKIIDHLEKTGVLARAADISKMNFATPAGSTYALLMSGPPALRLYENVGWGLKMLDHLDGLQALLEKGSAAAKAMDKLLAAIEPQRKKWRAQAQVQAPVPVPGPWAQLVNLPKLKKKATARAKLLKKDIDSFRLHLTHVDENRKATHAVTLSARKPAPAKPGGNNVAVQVTKEQAAAIIDYLETSACLGYMIDSVLLKILSMMIPAPHLHVHVATDKHSLEAFLGNWTWANGLVDGMRKVLPGDGPAAKELDKLTKALGAQRKKWAKGPFGRAAGQLGAALQQLLKSQVARFVLEVRYYGPQDKTKPFFSLTLSAAGLAGGLKRAPWAPAVQISKAQALKIIDHLHATGALNKAGNLRTKGLAPPKGPTYSLIVKGLPQLPLHDPLGWDLKMLQRLDALRKVLDGDAAKAMDKLLKALEPQRKKWQQPAAGKPATKPPVKWGKAVNGLVCGISAFKKNVHLGVPYQIEVSIKNVSTEDIGFFKTMLGNGDDRIILTRAGKQYREHYTIDSKAMEHAAVSAKDLVRLKPKEIYKFAHRTLIYPRSMAKKFWNIEVGLGHMAVSGEGVHQMHVKYEPRDLPIAKGTDLGGLKPWKGVLLSAPVEVVVAKAAAKQPTKAAKPKPALKGVAIRLTLSRAVLPPGESQRFTVVRKNLSSLQLQCPVAGPHSRCPSLRLKAPDGSQYVFWPYTRRRLLAITASAFRIIPPGKSDVLLNESVPMVSRANGWLKATDRTTAQPMFRTPGKYTAWVVYQVPKVKGAPADAWTGEVKSDIVTFTVKPIPPEKRRQKLTDLQQADLKSIVAMKKQEWPKALGRIGAELTQTEQEALALEVVGLLKKHRPKGNGKLPVWWRILYGAVCRRAGPARGSGALLIQGPYLHQLAPLAVSCAKSAATAKTPNRASRPGFGLAIAYVRAYPKEGKGLRDQLVDIVKPYADVRKVPQDGGRVMAGRIRFAWRTLLAIGVLHNGMTLAEAKGILGEPTSSGEGYVSWRYDSRMRVIPALIAKVSDDPKGKKVTFINTDYLS